MPEEPNGNDQKKELREVSKEELQCILTEHEKWVNSLGKKGKQADLSYVYLEKTNLEDVNLQKPTSRTPTSSRPTSNTPSSPRPTSSTPTSNTPTSSTPA